MMMDQAGTREIWEASSCGTGMSGETTFHDAFVNYYKYEETGQTAGTATVPEFIVPVRFYNDNNDWFEDPYGDWYRRPAYYYYTGSWYDQREAFRLASSNLYYETGGAPNFVLYDDLYNNLGSAGPIEEAENHRMTMVDWANNYNADYYCPTNYQRYPDSDGPAWEILGDYPLYYSWGGRTWKLYQDKQ